MDADCSLHWGVCLHLKAAFVQDWYGRMVPVCPVLDWFTFPPVSEPCSEVNKRCLLSPLLFLIFYGQNFMAQPGAGSNLGFPLSFLQMMLSCWLHQARAFSIYWGGFHGNLSTQTKYDKLNSETFNVKHLIAVLRIKLVKMLNVIFFTTDNCDIAGDLRILLYL